MLIFIPKLNSEEGEREREILFCLFPSAAPVFSALGTIPPPRFHVSVILNCSLIPYILSTSRTSGTIHSTVFYGQQQLIVNLSGPCITLTVLTAISPPSFQKSFRKAVSLDYFLLLRGTRIFENGR